MAGARISKTLKFFSFAAAIFAATLFASCENMGGDVASYDALLLAPAGGGGHKGGGSGTAGGSGGSSNAPGEIAGTLTASVRLPGLPSLAGIAPLSENAARYAGLSNASAQGNQAAASTDLAQPSNDVSKSAFPNIADAAATAYSFSATLAQSGTGGATYTADGSYDGVTGICSFSFGGAKSASEQTYTLTVKLYHTDDSVTPAVKSLVAGGSQSVTVEAAAVTFSASVQLDPNLESGSPNGSLKLPIKFSDTSVTSVQLKLVDSGNNDVTATYLDGVTGTPLALPLDSSGSGTIQSKDGGLPPGTYSLLMTFENGGQKLGFRTESLNVYPTMETSLWWTNGSDPAATLSVNKFVQKEFWVRGTGGDFYANVYTAATATALDTNIGSFAFPLASVQEAVKRIADNGDEATQYTIIVDGRVTGEADADYSAQNDACVNIACDRMITIKGWSGADKDIIDANKSAGAANPARAFYIESSKKIVLQKIAVTGGYLSAATDATAYGGGLYISGSTTQVELEDCVIKENSVQTQGGGAYIASGAKLTMNGSGSAINSNRILGKDPGSVSTFDKKACGGGVFVAQSATFLMNAGTLRENGAVYSSDSGAISGCAAYVCGTFTMKGGTIDSNAYKIEGASPMIVRCRNIEVAVPGTFNLYGGSITDDMGSSSYMNGSGVCVYAADYCSPVSSGAATFNMYGGTIGGLKSQLGGAVYLSAETSYSCEFNMSGGTISGNTATSVGGGGVYVGNNSVLNMSGGTISGNTAARGGGVYVGRNSVFNFTGGTIGGNTPTSGSGEGGGIFIDGVSGDKGQCFISGAAIVGQNPAATSSAATSADGFHSNKASQGGGIYNMGELYLGYKNASATEAWTGAICYNYASSGGGVYNGGILKMNSGSVCYNGNAGVDLASGKKLEMSGDATIPMCSDGSNYVYLYSGAIIDVPAAITSTKTPVATIMLGASSYTPDKVVLTGSALTAAECAKFAVEPDSAGDEWTIRYDSSTKKGVLATATIYVDGSAATEGSGTKDSPCKTVANALTKVSAPNCSIIIKEDTTESQNLTVTAAMAGLKIKSADATQKTITGADGKQIKIRTAITISNIAFDTWEGVEVGDSVATVELNDVTIKDCHNAMIGGGLMVGIGAKVKASNLKVADCHSGGGGGIYISSGSELNADGLTVTGCYADGTSGVAGGIFNGGTLIAKNAKISGCSALGGGAGIANNNGASLVLDGDCDISSQIYLGGKTSTMTTASNPIYVKAYFGLASGASKIPVAVEENSGAGEQFQAGDALVQGYSAYTITATQVNCFATSGTGLSLEYDGTATPPCGKLVDKSIAGGITVNLGGNISFVMATPSASGEKAAFSVLDNTVTPPASIDPSSARITSLRIEIKQYGSAIYSANAQEVAATYLAEGEYELYCKAVVDGVAYDTSVPFAAGGKYTPLTLEAAAAGAKITFTNKAADVVTYKKNGGAAQTIASGDSAEITLDNIGDKVQFFGDNTAYGVSNSANCSKISCSKDCYVYGNVMSLVKSDGFASEDTLTGSYNFADLFYNNTKIKNKTGYALVLPATTLTADCYYSMFSGCSGLTTAPALPATTLTNECYSYMFYGCSSLTAAPELPATTLASSCYRHMFCDCASLTTTPALPATTLASSCYRAMFCNCTSLTAAPALPATTLASNCYYSMFNGCSSLATAPELPATTLESNCYSDMFNGCTSLATAPELPATTLASYCYKNMFSGCTSLTDAPALPATTLKNDCYMGMFQSCSSLTTAPALPATTLESYCYNSMFRYCSSLTTAPELPATTLAGYCYTLMFDECTSLTTAPLLSAPILVDTCYYGMFEECSNLNSVTCLATDISANDCTKGWLSGVASTGTFTKAAGIGVDTSGGWTSNSASGIPEGWVVKGSGAVTTATPLTIEAAVAGATVTFTNKASDTVFYKKNDDAALPCNSGETAGIELENVGDKVQFYGDNQAYATGTGASDYSNIACSADCYVYGNIMSLVNSAGFASETALTASFTFCQLFKDNVHIKNKTGADLLLPATTMTEYCYYAMFYGCTSLTTAPELPATTLANSCYYGMFQDCTSLTAAPALPATTLANYCYSEMFKGCSSLMTAPELPATTLANSCCYGMFRDCTSLTVAPELPATTLANSCYGLMFYGCTSLTTAPVLPAPTLVENCYYYMFYYCSSLKSVTCLATNISASDCTKNWLNNVSANGTFYKASSMGAGTSGGWPLNSASGVPNTWTVEDYVAP